MNSYQYSNLSDENVDIRLLELLLGQFDDEIRVKIFHLPLVKRPEPSLPKLSLAELKATLPSKWGAFETVEGRFYIKHKETIRTSWIHPDHQVQLSSYGTVDEAGPCFSPQYEVLSYT